MEEGTIPLWVVQRVLTEIGADPECYRTHYTGATLDGEPCFAVVIPRANMVPVWLTAFAIEMEEEIGGSGGSVALDMAMDVCTDTLGTDTIVYYPGWQVG